MSNRNENYGNPSADFLMRRVWDAEHPQKGGMTTGDPRIMIHTSPVAHVCKSLQAVIAERDTLRERVVKLEEERDALLRDCWEACGGKGPDSSDDELVGTISTMRVGLERWQKRACDAEAERDALQAENAQLRDVLADRDMDREMAARSKLELIEANRQLDALWARIGRARGSAEE